MSIWRTALGAGSILWLALGGAAAAATYVDPVYGFSLTYPDAWPAEASSEGEDRVLRIRMPDGGATAEIRAVRLRRGVSARTMSETFAASALPQATLVGQKADSFAGLNGEIAAWRLSGDMAGIVVGGFFAADAPVGYVLLTVASEVEYAQRSAIIDPVLNTFKPGALVSAYVGETANAPPPHGQGGGENVDIHAGIVGEAHPELGFVLYRYAGWAVDQPAAHSIRVGPADLPAASRPSLTIESIAGGAYPSLRAAADDLKAQLADLPDIQFDQEGPHFVPNMALDGAMLDGWSFGATYRLNGVAFRQIVYLFKRPTPDVYHFIYATGPAEQLSAHQDEMMRMLQALQLVPFERR